VSREELAAGPFGLDSSSGLLAAPCLGLILPGGARAPPRRFPSWCAPSIVGAVVRKLGWLPWLVAVLVMAALWGPIFVPMAHDMPFGFHSWKQGDCLAIAQQYLEDDSWNILDPRVPSLLPVERRVNAELPLTPYLAAVGARMFGRSHLVDIYRILTLLLSALGPLALFGFVWHDD